jgi:hypothetical protein
MHTHIRTASLRLPTAAKAHSPLHQEDHQLALAAICDCGLVSQHTTCQQSLHLVPVSLACLLDLWHAKTKQELNASTRRATAGYRYSRPRSWGSSVENSVNTPCMVAGPEPVTQVLMYCIFYVLNLCTLVSQLLTLSRRIYLMFCLTACLIHIYLYRAFPCCYNTFFSLLATLKKIFFWGIFFFFLFVLYSALLHLLPLRFHCADGCWDRTQDRCNLCIGSQTL